MINPDSSLKISGFIVGGNSNPPTLILRVCNTFKDESNRSWAIAQCEQSKESAQLIALNYNDGLGETLTFKFTATDNLMSTIGLALSNHIKVWLTFKRNNNENIIESLQWKVV